MVKIWNDRVTILIRKKPSELKMRQTLSIFSEFQNAICVTLIDQFFLYVPFQIKIKGRHSLVNFFVLIFR